MQNFARVWRTLSADEKAIIGLVTETAPNEVPFLQAKYVVDMLKLSRQRKVRHLAERCKGMMSKPEAGLVMPLDDALVLKYFGKRPDLGRRLTGATTKVTVGVKWSLPKLAWVDDDDVTVNFTVALHRLTDGQWGVLVDDRCRDQALEWLQQHCVRKPVAPVKKRVRQFRKRCNR